MARGLVQIDGKYQYYDNDGYQVKGQIVTDKDGNIRYFKADSGEMVVSDFVKIGDNNWYYFDANGVAVTGAQTIEGQDLYFDENGVQVKGSIVTNTDGSRSYYDADSGQKMINKFFTTGDNNWYYADSNGNLVTGSQTIKGQKLNFESTGLQDKGKLIETEDGSKYYYDADSGQMIVNKFESVNGLWYYFGLDGKAVTGSQVINGQHLYFNVDGSQVKGSIAIVNDHRTYYDPNSGEMARNQWVTLSDGSEVF